MPRRANPKAAATDPAAAAKQKQIKADHDALERSAKRVRKSVSPEVRNTPVKGAKTDPKAAAVQKRVKADHDALERSAKRVKASVPAPVRNTPVRSTRSTATRRRSR